MSFAGFMKAGLCDGTHFDEKGKSVRIKPEGGETILVFKTDSDAFRKEFRVGRASDVLFLVQRPRARPRLLFVELKGTHIGDAADQLKETVAAVSRSLQQRLGLEYPTPADMTAIVVRGGSAPTNQQDIQERFYKATKLRLNIEREAVDLRKYLSSAESSAAAQRPNSRQSRRR